jgi:hypothetical protein
MAENEGGIGPWATPEQVLVVLDAEEDDRLVGCFETDDVEFKGVYRLHEESEKWELAKDVAAFPNANGGVIVVGVLTKEDPDSAEDRVERVRPIDSGMFDPKQVRQVVEKWVYPQPHVEVRRHPRGDKCLGSIRVTSKPGDLPYLVNRIRAEGRISEDTGIAWPVRQGARTRWTTVGQVHEAIRKGDSWLQHSDVSVAPPESPTAFDLDSSLQSVEAFMGWDTRAFVWLAAVPSEAQSIPKFYGDSGVERAIRDPYALRYAGFGLTYGRYENVDGRLVSADGDERYFEVRPNGVAIAAAGAGSGFLTRGGRVVGVHGDAQPEAINPVVIAEWTYLFCRFVATNLATRATGPWRLYVGVRGARSRQWSLRMRRGQWSNQQTFLGEGTEAGQDSWNDVVAATGTPEVDAYSILHLLYDLFGQEVDELDLVESERVSPQAIIALSQS